MVIGSWKKVNITELLKPNGIKIGPFGSQLKKELFVTNGLYKVYGQENVYAKDFKIGDRFMTRQHFEKLSSCELKPGDFVMTTMGTVGKCTIVPDDIQTGVMDSHLIRMRFNEKGILPSYLLQLFSPEYSFLSSQTDKLSVGGIMDGLSVKIVSSLQVECPEDIKEQQKIAEALSDMDNLISSLEKLIEKKKAVKQGAVQELLTGKKRLPGFNGKWEQQKLNTCTERIIVGLATSVTKHYSAQGTVLFRNLNILPNKLDDSDVLFLDSEFANTYLNKRVRKNDVLTVHTGYVGISCLVPEKYEGALTFTTLITTTKKEILLPEYLMIHLNSELGKKMIELLQAGGGRNNLNVSDFERYEISFPKDTNEQKAIADILFDMDAEITSLEQKLAKCQKLKQGMMQQLLTGKIRLI